MEATTLIVNKKMKASNLIVIVFELALHPVRALLYCLAIWYLFHGAGSLTGGFAATSWFMGWLTRKLPLVLTLGAVASREFSNRLKKN